MYENMETVDYNPPEDVDLSDAEAVQYNIGNAERVKAPLKTKKSSKHIFAKKIQTKYCQLRAKKIKKFRNKVKTMLSLSKKYLFIHANL